LRLEQYGARPVGGHRAGELGAIDRVGRERLLPIMPLLMRVVVLPCGGRMAGHDQQESGEPERAGSPVLPRALPRYPIVQHK
jgi:hypothetical protein